MFKRGLIAIVAIMLVGCAEEEADPSSFAQVETDVGDNEVHLAGFWTIMDEIGETTNASRKLATLKTTLNKMTAEEIASFQHALESELAAAYSWDLWGAAYVINGGCSDDCFEYFRQWLISQGQSVFEQAKSNPDALADLIDWQSIEDTLFEELTYIGWDIWCEKTGLTWDDLSASEVEHLSVPSGQPFAEDSDDLRARYPELWKRFGESPL